MKNTKNKQCLVWSTFFVMGAFLISLLTGRETGFTMIRGEPLADYEINLNATNAPTSSVEYISTSQVVRYTTFDYTDAMASSGNHVEVGPWGYIANSLTSPITSITGVTATFLTEGVVTLYASYDNYNWFDYTLTSGVRFELQFYHITSVLIVTERVRSPIQVLKSHIPVTLTKPHLIYIASIGMTRIIPS